MVDLNIGRALVPAIVDVIVDMTVAEYPTNEAARLMIYEKIGENLLAMVRCLRGENTPIVLELD